MEAAFAIIAGLIAYVFAVFPVLLMAIGRIPDRRRSRSRRGVTPTVAVLVAARNERGCIAEKIRNTLASVYPPERLTMYIGSDGSTDGTDAVVEQHAGPRVRLVPFPAGPGKAAVINGLARQAEADVLVMSDADVRMDPNAIAALAGHFSDPRVGAVCARRSDRRRGTAGIARQARLYNAYEGAVKRGEGRLGRVLGGNGSLYAMRSALFRPLPPGVPDDFVGILRVMERGYAVRYEDGAVSREVLPVAAGPEFARRRRTVARGIRGLWTVRGLLNPFRYPLTAFLLLSHKVLRWAAGFLLLALLALNVLLLTRPLFAVLFAAQVLFYTLSVLTPPLRPLRAARYFVLLNLAAMAGVLDVLRGRDWRRWDVARPQGACP